MAAEARELEKKERQERREAEKKDREVEREVLHCIERVVRKVEKENEHDESGLPFIDAKQLKGGGVKLPTFKVHGQACMQYLTVDLAGFTGARNQEIEAAVRSARMEEVALQRERQQQMLATKPPKVSDYSTTQSCAWA